MATVPKSRGGESCHREILEKCSNARDRKLAASWRIERRLRAAQLYEHFFSFLATTISPPEKFGRETDTNSNHIQPCRRSRSKVVSRQITSSDCPAKKSNCAYGTGCHDNAGCVLNVFDWDRSGVYRDYESCISDSLYPRQYSPANSSMAVRNHLLTSMSRLRTVPHTPPQPSV